MKAAAQDFSLPRDSALLLAFALLATQAPPPAPPGCEQSTARDYELPFTRAPRCIAAYQRLAGGDSSA